MTRGAKKEGARTFKEEVPVPWAVSTRMGGGQPRGEEEVFDLKEEMQGNPSSRLNDRERSDGSGCHRGRRRARSTIYFQKLWRSWRGGKGS